MHGALESVTESFYQIARADPDRLAIVDADGSEFTYGELHARVNRVSHGLRAQGLAAGDAVAVVLPNGADFTTVQLATGQLGMFLVPINWHLAAPEIAYIVADSGAALVVADPKYGVTADVPVFTSLDDLTGPETPPEDRRAGSVMFYTSGTTGRPKGVRRALPDMEPEPVLEIIAQAVCSILDLESGDGVHLLTGPQYHSAPCTHALMALHLGHSLVIASKFDAENTLALIQKHRVTNTFMVPTHFHRLLALPEDVRAAYDTSSLTQLIHAAAACPPNEKRRMIEWLGPVLHEYYGSTESAIVVAVNSRDWLAHPGTVGHPVLGIDIKIFDDEGNELPPGEPGLIYASVADGFEYHRDPAKTERARRGAYFTPGDIGYLDEDGYLYLCDRRTDLIISGGVNIYPAEIEAALLEHPAVTDAVAFGVPDPEWGQKVVALIQPGAEVTAKDLRAHCEGRLARFKHPRVIEFRDELPRNAAGKISRYRVRESYLATSV
jgi:long-chain acyl-CoA synthetase